MNDYDASTYGERIADIYDELHQGLADVQATVDALADLAQGGRALELGIGTGRIALPLAERGVEVHGIDASPAMVARLREKEGGAQIPVAMGDFVDVAVEGDFSLIFVAFNTFFGLLSQEDQVRCFRNVAHHVSGDGVFVIEAFVPDVTRFVRGQNITAPLLEMDRVLLDVSRHDPVTQRVVAQHLLIMESGTRLYPVQLRYAWPSELDLMSQLAGMRLRERWGSWRREPFTAASTNHVSVYEKA
ncbi:MAG: class I SAM-dependent methyltransferase [Chloroflexi bacterium]|nr:class I SAM-dependent methyltransferase [Chloroflexota bacterium]